MVQHFTIILLTLVAEGWFGDEEEARECNSLDFTKSESEIFCSFSFSLAFYSKPEKHTISQCEQEGLWIKMSPFLLLF